MKDLDFLGGAFFDYELPKEKRFLNHYFKTEIEQAFLKYLFCFGNLTNFVNNTGLIVQGRWLAILRRRLNSLLELHAKTKKEMNFELLKKIETGKLKLQKGGKCFGP